MRLPNLPPKRERLTPVNRLRRRARASDLNLVIGHYGNGEAARRTMGFRVVCWNIEDGLDVDGGIQGLAGNENLRTAAAICLQEMDPAGVQRLAGELGLNYVYSESSRDQRSGRGFGNAILSPFPLADCSVLPLPYVAKAYGRPRAAVNAVVKWPGGDVSVWSVHAEIASLSLTRRISQYTAVAARAVAPNPDHLVIAGDFNTTTLTSVEAVDELYELFDLQRVSAGAGPSLRRAGKLFHLDHVFARGLDVLHADVEREVIASDHWPLWVELRPSSPQFLEPVDSAEFREEP